MPNVIGQLSFIILFLLTTITLITPYDTAERSNGRKKINKQLMDCDAQLAALFSPTQRAILTRKVGHTDLVFGVRSGFIGRSVYTRLQLSVSSDYNLFHPS